jgi:hypothetical protein
MELIEIIAVTGKYPFHGVKSNRNNLYLEAKMDIIAWKNVLNDNFINGDFYITKNVSQNELKDLQRSILPNCIVSLKVRQDNSILYLLEIIEMINIDEEIKKLFPAQANNFINISYRNNDMENEKNISYDNKLIKYLEKKVIFHAKVVYKIIKNNQYNSEEITVVFYVEKSETEEEINNKAKELINIELLKKYKKNEILITKVSRIIDDIPEWKNRPRFELTQPHYS